MEGAKAGTEHESLRVVQGSFDLQFHWIKLIFTFALLWSLRSLDCELMGQNTFYELGSLLHVLDLGSKLEEEVELESLALDLG